jgi:hypothetical protein
MLLKPVLVSLALSFACVSSTWAQFTSADIVGNYIVKGTDLDGSSYDGTVSIKPDASGGVSIRWDDGSTGLGMIEGSKLYVGMVYEKRSIIMSMDIKPGVISGKWIQRTYAGNGLEQWRK